MKNNMYNFTLHHIIIIIFSQEHNQKDILRRGRTLLVCCPCIWEKCFCLQTRNHNEVCDKGP